VELVVPGHLLVELSTTVVLEDDEVAQEFEEVALVEHTLQEHLQMFCGQFLANGQRLAIGRLRLLRATSALQQYAQAVVCRSEFPVVLGHLRMLAQL
jgi:hypothetical protein